MAAYLVATVRITDPEKFALYAKAIAGVCETHGGTYLARGKVSEVLEGDVSPEERVVVIRFDSAEAAKGYINSPEYQAGKAHRQGGAELEMRLIVDPA